MTEPPGVGAASGPGILLTRLVLPAAAMCLAAIVALCGARAELARVGAGYNVADSELLPAIDAWRAGRARAERTGGAIFGDSVAYLGGIGVELADRLKERGQPADVLSVAHVGLRPVHAYYLLDRVLGGRPEFVVVEVNPFAFVPRWARAPEMRMPELSRELSPARAWRIRAALAAEEIGLLDPWVYRGEASLGMLHVADGARYAAEQAILGAGRRAGASLGLRGRPRARPPLLGLQPLDEPLAREIYGGEIGDDASLAVLRALLAELRAAGVATVVYVTPLDVETMRSLGLEKELDLPAKLERLRARIGATEAEWLDLHALLPSADIRDHAGHLSPRGAQQVSDALADAVAERLARPAP